MKLLDNKQLRKEVQDIFKNQEFANTNYIRHYLLQKGYTHYKYNNGTIKYLKFCRIGHAFRHIPEIKRYSKSYNGSFVYIKNDNPSNTTR